MKSAAVALFVAATLAGDALADVYRCEVEGKVVYADRPCQKDAKPLKIEANSVGEVDQSGLAAKRKAIDARLNAKIKTDAASREQDRVAVASWRAECDSYADAYQRQAAWLGSISYAVRASAATEMQIQRRKWLEAGCKPVGATNDEPPWR